MKAEVKRFLILILAAVTLVPFCSCSIKPSLSVDQLDAYEDTVEHKYSFSEDAGTETVQLNEAKTADFLSNLAAQNIAYGYDELFCYEKAMQGVCSDHSVATHAYSALDENGILTKEHLFETVRKNNAAYLADTALVGDIDDDTFLMRICEIIVDATNATLSAYPQIDKDRVYCNLGNLKIVEKVSALDFAAVEPDMVLHVNRNTAAMTSILTSSNMYNVIVHETMHILQFGCSCERIEGCLRRCGMAHAYSGWEQDYADWLWLAEGSAERMADLYAGVEAMTYHTLVNYILTLDLATVTKDDVPANYLETLNFYGDPEKLFALFDADTEAEKREIYQMIYSLEIMQTEPEDVKKAYRKYYDTEWTDEVRDDVNLKVKRPILQTVTKIFFANLTSAVRNHSVTKNDVMFLLYLFENTLCGHLKLNNAEYDAYNVGIREWYGTIREGLFACFENLTGEEYSAYSAVAGENKLNAGMNWLAQDKKEFLIEKFELESFNYKFDSAAK